MVGGVLNQRLNQTLFLQNKINYGETAKLIGSHIVRGQAGVQHAVQTNQIPCPPPHASTSTEPIDLSRAKE